MVEHPHSQNADTEPEFRDYEMKWPLDTHAEGIGCTGWDWSARRSRWVGFDFDSITGHAAGVGVSDEELHRVSEAAQALPYVEVRAAPAATGSISTSTSTTAAFPRPTTRSTPLSAGPCWA
jgi:hypothetical protein